MIYLFAESVGAPPQGFDQFLQCIAYASVTIAAVIHAIRSLQKHPSTEKQLAEFRDHAHQTFATKAELEEKIDAREETAVVFRNEMRDDIDALTTKLSARTGEIFTEIRSASAQIAHLEGRLFNRGHK